jgi:CHAD domain-containing protein
VASDLEDFRRALSPIATEYRPGARKPDPGSTAGAYGYASLRREFSNFLQHQLGTRLAEDPEELHQMRVAARRLRAFIKLFKPALTPSLLMLTGEVKWIAGVLGVRRDLDVQMEWLRSVIEDAGDEKEALRPLFSHLEQRACEAQATVSDALDSERFDGLVRAMSEALLNGPNSAAESELPVSVFASRRLRGRYRRFRMLAQGLVRQSEDAAFHQLRVEAKRLRYATECFRPIFGSRVRPLIRETKVLQDLLGEHHDATVFEAEVRAQAHDGNLPPDSLIALGGLIRDRQLRRLEIRDDYPRHHRRLKKAWRKAKNALTTS